MNSIQNEIEKPGLLDEIYQERAIAIILSAACIEAFLNGLGYENYPNEWDKIERNTFRKKVAGIL